MNIDRFDYFLPPNLIANVPVEPRHSSKLMVLDRISRTLQHCKFWDVKEYLKQDDLLVFNDTRVFNARLYGFFSGDSKSRIEIFLVEKISTVEWKIICKPAKKFKIGTEIQLIGQKGLIKGIVNKLYEDEYRGIKFDKELDLQSDGVIPLPPYIKKPLDDDEKYQTVYARNLGSIAAPTAGLHFTDELMDEITDKRVELVFLTLNIGPGTFKPVRVNQLDEHKMHHEKFRIDNSALKAISNAKNQGRRIICVGTTTVRVLEHLAMSEELKSDKEKPSNGFLEGQTDLFIYPGYKFKIVDGLITNFHLPRSTLLMLVSAFAEQFGEVNSGTKLIKQSYEKAVEMDYRFYSFGDAMLII